MGDTITEEDQDEVVNFIRHEARNLNRAMFVIQSQQLPILKAGIDKITTLSHQALVAGVSIDLERPLGTPDLLIVLIGRGLEDFEIQVENFISRPDGQLFSSYNLSLSIERISSNSPAELTIGVGACAVVAVLLAINWILACSRKDALRKMIVGSAIELIRKEISNDNVTQAQREIIINGMNKILNGYQPSDTLLSVELSSPAASIKVSAKDR